MCFITLRCVIKRRLRKRLVERAMSMYERLYPHLRRFVWWFPLEIKDARMNFPERLLLAHLDWMVKASAAGSAERRAVEEEL